MGWMKANSRSLTPTIPRFWRSQFVHWDPARILESLLVSVARRVFANWVTHSGPSWIRRNLGDPGLGCIQKCALHRAAFENVPEIAIETKLCSSQEAFWHGNNCTVFQLCAKPTPGALFALLKSNEFEARVSKGLPSSQSVCSVTDEHLLHVPPIANVVLVATSPYWFSSSATPS